MLIAAKAQNMPPKLLVWPFWKAKWQKTGLNIAIQTYQKAKANQHRAKGLLHPFEELDKGRVIDCDPLHHSGSEHRDGVLVGPEAGIVVIDAGND